jgi:hypothetical protein
MANGKDNTNLYLAIGVGGLAFYLWQQQKAAEQLLAAQGPGPLGTGQPTAGPQQLQADPLLGAAAAGLDAILPGAGALAPLAVKLGQEVVNEGEAMLDGIIHGGLDLETAGRVAELVTAPFSVPLVASYNFVADLFGWSGKPLDSVNDVLLNRISIQPADPNYPVPVKDNVQYGQPIFALDSLGALHQLVPGTDINQADFSWREIIAVSQSVIDGLPKAGMITNRRQIQPIGRPLDAGALRQAFGNDIIFKLGASNDLHGPWEVGYTWVGGQGWMGPEEYAAASALGIARQRVK